MSSSPSRAPLSGGAVQSFEYQDTGSKNVIGSQSSDGNTLPGRGLSGDVDAALAAARAEGVREGLIQAQQNLAKEIADERFKVAETLKVFEKKTSEYFGRVEVELVHLSLGIAAKILHREAQVDRMLVAALVKVALEKLQQGTRVIVHVRPDEVADWTKYAETNLAGKMKVEIKGDFAVEPHNCVLETELGETQLGIDAQLKEIEQGFFDLLAQRPDPK